ncbi:MAG: hypothetical protein ABIQ74_10885, partial [Chitinophagales bacterium]
MYSLWFTNKDTGWAAGLYNDAGLGPQPEILRTNDAGQTWQNIYQVDALPSGESFVDIRFKKNEKDGFVLAEFSYDAATTDGGINWGLTHDTDTSGLPFLYGIYNTLDGFEDMYLAGQYGTLLKWKKDSSEWQDVSGRLCSWINDISFSSGSHGWISSGRGILKTIDGGQNWNSVASPLLNMKVIDGVNDSLIISSDANNIYRSINGGQSWSTVYSGSDTSMNARDIRMIDETTGYIFSFTGN